MTHEPSGLKHVYSVLSAAPLLSVHIATLLFGLAGVLGAAIGLGAVEVTFGRTLFASLALLFVCRVTHTALPVGKLRRDWLLLFSGVLLALHWIAFFASIQLSTVAIGLVMFSTCPVFVALLESVFFKEKWRITNIVAALLVFIGVLIISGVSSGEFTYIRGVLCGFASGFSFAILQLLNRRLTNTHGALFTATTQNTVSAVVLLPIVFFSLNRFAPGQWMMLVVLGVFCTALAQTLFIDSLKRLSVSTASIIAAGLEPVYGIVLALLLLSQKPSPGVITGGLIILASVLFVTVQSHAAKQA